MSSLNEFSFLRICSDIAKNKVKQGDVDTLYAVLEKNVKSVEDLNFLFGDDSPTLLRKSQAIDGVAHAIQCRGEGLFKQVFDPNANFNFFKSELDGLAGFDATCEIRKSNRGFFTTFFDESSFMFLEKAAVGRIQGEDIQKELGEYVTLLKAGMASDGEVLTLSRAFPENSEYQSLVKQRGIDKNLPMVVGGPASVEIIDKQRHLVTTEALDTAFTNFMKNPRTRNIQVLHTNFQVGWPMPVYINADGEIFKSGVDDKGLWLISELRDDLIVSKKIKEQIEKKVIKSYSIAGTATSKQEVRKDGAEDYTQIDGLELAEITLCYDGANQDANFDIIKSEQTDTPPSILINDPPPAFGKDEDCGCDEAPVKKTIVSFDTSIFEKIIGSSSIIKGDTMAKTDKLKEFTDWTAAEAKRRKDVEARGEKLYGIPRKGEFDTKDLDTTRYSSEKDSKDITKPQDATSG